MQTRRNLWVFVFQCFLAFLVIGAWVVFIINHYNIELGHGAFSFEALPVPGDVVENSLAYIGTDNHIWMINQGNPNSARRISTREGNYTLPTWSSDGRWIAFTGRLNDRWGIFLNTTNQTTQSTLFSSRDRRPFFLKWSPDNQFIGFLSSVDGQVELRSLALIDPKINFKLANASRVYWTWGSSGEQAMINVGGHLLMRLQGRKTESELLLNNNRIQSPVWDTVNNRTFYVRHENYIDYTLYSSDLNFDDETPLMEVSGSCRLALSRDGRYLGVLVANEYMLSPFWSNSPGRIILVDTESGAQQQISENLAFAFYFSPDSSKIAVLRRFWGNNAGESSEQYTGVHLLTDRNDLGSTIYEVLIYDIEEDTLDILAVFKATRRFHGTVSFFDQFHESHNFWSPDSRYFVISHLDESDIGRIIILDSLKEEIPKHVADGTFAVWSWQ